MSGLIRYRALWRAQEEKPHQDHHRALNNGVFDAPLVYPCRIPDKRSFPHTGARPGDPEYSRPAAAGSRPYRDRNRPGRYGSRRLYRDKDL